MKIRIALACLLALFISACSDSNPDNGQHSDAEVNRLLHQLDREIQRRDIYIDHRRARIDSLKATMLSADPMLRAGLLRQIGDLFVAFNNDSALTYYNYALRAYTHAGHDSLAQVVYITRLAYMPLEGFNGTAQQRFLDVDTTRMSTQMKTLYYNSGRQMYNFIASFFAANPQAYGMLREGHRENLSKLVNILPPGTPDYDINRSELLMLNGQFTPAEQILASRLNLMHETDPEYARACNLLAQCMKSRSEYQGQLYWLARSAIADVRNATLEVTSLQELGREIFQHGDEDRAYRYIQTALANAIDCHAILRIVESTEGLPLIEQTAAHNRQRARTFRIIAFAILGVVVVALAFGIRYLWLVNKKISLLKSNLEQSDATKSGLINHFISYCSINLEKHQQMIKSIERKLKTGLPDEVLTSLKNGNYTTDHRNEFFKIFDNTFLTLHPQFPLRVNQLLRPDEQLPLPEDGRLSTELRILALSILGIDDGGQIAHLLGYSVNTIYAYRNRLKNKAINRDTFEQQLHQIKSY